MTSASEDNSNRLQRAVDLHRAGEEQQAELLYREILTLNPDDLNANYLLGLIELGRQQFNDAVSRLRRACTILPSEPLYHYKLGLALQGLGDVDGAERCFQNALELRPAYVDAVLSLTGLWHAKGETDRAVDKLLELLEQNHQDTQTYRRIGEWAMGVGRFDLAVKAYKLQTERKVDDGEAYFYLGNAYFRMDRFEDAAAAFRRSVELLPNVAGCYGNLGNTLDKLGDPRAASEAIRKAIELKPDNPQLYINLAHALSGLVDTEKAVDAYKKALTFDPKNFSAASNMLLILNYTQAYTDAEIFSLHRFWGERFEEQYKPRWNRRRVDVSNRRLRLGYISGDFKRHSVAFFFEPVIEHHDRGQFETYGYSMVRSPDEITARIKKKFDHWRNIDVLDADTVATIIRNDQIDILVDLSGHSSLNRMPVIAQKPAPIQVSWLGYPNTTGLTSVDYRFTDEVADPPGEADLYHTEQLFRLKEGFLCYRGEPNAQIVESPPVYKRGYITFVSFNSMNKLNRKTVADWSRLLLEFEGSRILIKCGQLEKEINRDRLTLWFEEEGVDRQRLDLRGMVPGLEEHLALYGEADIALDPRPYNGTTTTFEALWMGVPVLTVTGNSHRGRVGTSILQHLGLEYLIAKDTAELVAKARALVEQPQLLADLRKGLRRQIITSSFCDEQGFVFKIEEAYRTMVKNQEEV